MPLLKLKFFKLMGVSILTSKSVTLNVWKNNSEFAMAVQGEVDSRFLTVTLIDDHGPLDLTNKSVKFLARKPDGTVIFNNMDIEDAQKGIAVLGLTSQISAVAGILENCEVHIVSENGETLIAKKINLLIQPALDAATEESLSEITAYQELMNKVDSIEEHSFDKNNPHEVSAEQLGIVQLQPDWEQTDEEALDYIKNKPPVVGAITDLDEMTGVLPIEKGGTSATTVNDAWKNLQIYTDISQLGLSYPTTTTKIFQAMPVGSIGLFAFDSKYQTVTDAPISYGIYSIFYPVVERPLLLCMQCISTGSNYSGFYAGYYNSSGKKVNWFRIFNGSMQATIAQGGTGATTAEKALTNLGAARSADIGDVTTLSTTDKTVVGAINELYSLIQSQ